MSVGRPLTGGETALARRAFGTRVALDRVTLFGEAAGNPVAAAAFRNGNTAITLRNRIYFRLAYFLADFSAGKPAAQGLLIHELTHVWQWAVLGVPRFLGRYGREFAACGFKAWRMYDYREGATPFAAARLEAQAQMAGDYAEALAAGDAARSAVIAANLKDSGLFGL